MGASLNQPYLRVKLYKKDNLNALLESYLVSGFRDGQLNEISMQLP